MRSACVISRAAGRPPHRRRRTRPGREQPLLGVPMAVKESYNVAGLPTRGAPRAEGRQPAGRRAVISRVKADGGVVVGKTNVPLALDDWQSYNDIYGTTRNPWDLTRSPRRLVRRLGRGARGRIRSHSRSAPTSADRCGYRRISVRHLRPQAVYGHCLPGRGNTPPRTPALPRPPGSPRGRAHDAQRRRSFAAARRDRRTGSDRSRQGLSARAAAAAPRRAEQVSRAADRHRSGAADRQQPCARRSRSSRANLGKAGVAVDALRARYCPTSPPRRGSICGCCCRSSQASFQPEIYAGAKDAAAKLAADDSSLAAERLRGIALSHRDWLMADGASGAAAGAMARVVQELRRGDLSGDADAGLSARSFGRTRSSATSRSTARKYPYPDQLAWPGIATLPGLPATAIPIGLSPEGLPVGVQIVGPWLEDRTPLKLAELIEREFGGFVPPPMFDD